MTGRESRSSWISFYNNTALLS